MVCRFICDCMDYLERMKYKIVWLKNDDSSWVMWVDFIEISMMDKRVEWRVLLWFIVSGL